jgi:hypothetical protein
MRGMILLKKRVIGKIVLLSIMVFSIFGCSSDSDDSHESFLRDLSSVNIETQISSDILKVKKEEDGDTIELLYEESVTENAGSENEKKCLCQGVAFRVSQIASQVWSDGIFRTYEIEEIRTGWNTDGPYEFFSDEEHNGEIGDLEIPAEKIVIDGFAGATVTSGKNLTIEDSWYEITFVNGEKLMLRGTMGEAGIYTEEFLELRSKVKNGDTTVVPQMQEERKKVERNLGILPFDRIVIVSDEQN